MDKETILSELERLHQLLGRPPKRDDLAFKSNLSRLDIEKVFGTFTAALKAAGLDRVNKKNIKLKYVKPSLTGFNVHELDLEKLFQDYGNPESIKLVAQPDTHVKNMDERAFSCYLEFLHWYQPHIDLMLGDFIDADGLSHWPSDSLNPKRIVPELLRARDLLKYKVSLTPETKARIFICGNHEDWVRQALLKMPELFQDLPDLGIDISVQSLLDLKNYGYDFIPLNHIFKVGLANFTHGCYTPQNHARKHIEVFKCNIYYGHLHDTQSCTVQSVFGPLHAQSLACLCKLDAPFLKSRPNNWEHGFGVFEFFRDGSYVMHVQQIKNGLTIFNGKVFKA